MTAAGCELCDGLAIWKPLITLIVCILLAMVGLAVGYCLVAGDATKGAESQEEKYEMMVKAKRVKLAKALDAGDPVKIRDAKKQLHDAENTLSNIKRRIAETNNRQMKDDSEMDMNPLATVVAADMSSKSAIGKGSGTGVEQSGDVSAGDASASMDDDGGAIGMLFVVLAELDTAIKILLSYVQCTSVLPLSMPGLNWPTAFVNGFATVFAFASFDFGNVIPVGCLGNVNAYDHFIATIYMPVVIIFLIFLGFTLHTVKARGITFADSATLMVEADGVFNASLIALFVLYPNLSMQVCSIFDCRKIGDDYWLRSDVQLMCYDDVWTQYAAVAVCAVLVYPIGIPLLFYTLLARNRTRLQTPGMQARCGFLYSGFIVTFWGGELLELARKFMASTMVVFIANGSISQIGIMLVASSIFLAIHVNFQPYEQALENRIQGISLWGTTLILFIAFLLTFNKCEFQNELGQANTTGMLFEYLLLLVAFATMGLSSISIFEEIFVQNTELFEAAYEEIWENFLEPMMEGEVEEGGAGDEAMGLADSEGFQGGEGFDGDSFEQAAAVGLGATMGAQIMAHDDLANIEPHVVNLATSLFDMYRYDDNVGITRQGFKDFLHRWDHTDYDTIGKTAPIFARVSGGHEEIGETAFIIWCGQPDMFGGLSALTCRNALDEFATERNPQDSVPLYKSLWIGQLFNVHAKNDKIAYLAFYAMMKTFSRDVDPVLVKATFKRMAQVDKNLSASDVKLKMANAIKLSSGAQTEMESADDNYDIMAHGITQVQFTKWAAAVFLNCEASEFIEGITEMIRTDGSDLRRPSGGVLRAQNKDSEDDEEENPMCGPVDTFNFVEVFEELGIDAALEELISSSRYSIWRSIKGRELAADMIVSSKLTFTDVASLIEHRRRELTVLEGVDEYWPPRDTDAKRVSKQVMDKVFKMVDSAYCADQIRKTLVLEYIRQVNRGTYANKTLKDQMQALVLATSEVLVEKISEGGYVSLKDAYRL